MDDAAAAWTALGPEWRRCLELAWESYRARSMGVGAVITDRSGGVVAEGRSRWFERHQLGPDLAGSKVSHAETEALARLAAGYGLDGHTLWTSLEPCVLCAGAIVIAGVPVVRFMGSDPVIHGIERLPELNAYVASRWPERHGPLPGQFGAFATALPISRFVTEFAAREGSSLAHEALRAHDPRLAELAADLAADQELRSHDSVSDVLGELWERLSMAVG